MDGKPLIGRVIQHALEANCIDTILVTTDDIEIADVAQRYGAEVPFIRPEKHSGDLSTTEDTLKHALLKYEKMFKKYFDIAVFLTPTDIFRKAKWIAQAVKKLKDSPKLDSVFVGYNTHKNFWEMNAGGKWERVCGWMKDYSSRQVRSHIVREDTGLMCVSRAWLWRQGRRIGDNVDIIINHDAYTAIDIHHQEDLDLANNAIKLREKSK